MTTLRAVLPAADYLSACRFSSREETRYYLNGAYIDVGAKRIVATDGHRMGIIEVADDMWAAAGAAPFIITNAKSFMSACKPGRNETVWLRCFDEHVEIVKHTAGMAVTAEGLAESNFGTEATIPSKVAYVDGAFPEYMRVLPRTLTGHTYATDKDGKPTSAHGFRSDFLASFAASKKQSVVNLVPNGEGPAMVFNADPRFIGVVMPVRGGVLPETAIDRINGLSPPVADAEAA